ncbi:HNH endonuclease signature motif containing protein [Xanthobacter sp. ZOL 2024]
MPTAEAPFLRFLRGYVVDKATGCWLWVGHKYPNGYGAIKSFGRTISAHRFAYELYKGPIPEGMEILHSCDVKNCVNPDHLRVGTHRENMEEASARGLMPSGVNSPKYGKPNPRPRQSNRVRVLGVEYESQKAAERALGLGSGTVAYWLKNCPNKATMISIGELNGFRE